MRIPLLSLASLVLISSQAQAARPDYSELFATLDRDSYAVHAETGLRVDTRDFSHAGRNVEALGFTPAGAGPFPALLLIPGYGSSARDWTVNGLAFAGAGYYCLVVAQQGFGKSEGEPDFVGPETIASLTAAWQRLSVEPQVDSSRMGIVGYSRGAMAAALLATQLADVRAVVLGAGIYDFRMAFGEISSPMIKTNMVRETGGTEAGLSDYACEVRSSILYMDKLSASVLILHGDQDLNAPVTQAYLLRDRLTDLGKDFEVHIIEGKEHSIGLEDFQKSALGFLARKLSPDFDPSKG